MWFILILKKMCDSSEFLYGHLAYHKMTFIKLSHHLKKQKQINIVIPFKSYLHNNCKILKGVARRRIT